jgi:dGTPase
LFYQKDDFRRSLSKKDDEEWRPSFFRDYGRIIHSPSFRRLQDKTQVFPGHESDFFRNRLTHSLEVAQIAEGIADRLNTEHPELKKMDARQRIDTRLCAAASLIHDLGHPPFGHNGERALDHAMHSHGGFEGNAQTLRIVTKLERKARDANNVPYGLDLCYRTLASILKYDSLIPRARPEGAKLSKGYYQSEREIVSEIKKHVLGSYVVPDGEFKTVECAIMDIADDIAYSTYDLEDSLKAGFLTPAAILSSPPRLMNDVAKKVSDELQKNVTAVEAMAVFVEIFTDPNQRVGDKGDLEKFIDQYNAYDQLAKSGYFRTQLSSQLVKEAIGSVTLTYNADCPAMSKVHLSAEAKLRVEVLKQYTYLATIFSSRVKLPEYRGYEVVMGIFKALAGPKGHLLMPDDVRDQYYLCGGDMDTEMRLICDFVAGMTDRYAMEFYGRLHSDGPQSMFKPI